MLIDAHCHLDQLEDASAALDRAAAAGVLQVVAVSEDEPSMRRVLDLRAAHPDLVLSGLGLHPATLVHQDPETREASLRFLEAHIDRADLVGEIGLDRKHATDPAAIALQEACLARQMDLAAANRLAVNLHSRRAERETMERAIAYTRRTGLGALLHWFTHSRKLVRAACEAGVYVSAGPAILHSPEALGVAGEVAEHLLLLETDSPVPFGGEPAEPAWVPRVAEALARARGTTVEALATRTSENFVRYLGR